VALGRATFYFCEAQDEIAATLGIASGNNPSPSLFRLPDIEIKFPINALDIFANRSYP
jgi:hypothetical protein